jgi:GNAT superfamily N-acetyltransferase
VHREAGAHEPATIRHATPDDIPAIRSILAAHGNDDLPGQLRGPDIVGPYLRHLLAHHRVMVSESPGREVVAFGAVAEIGLAGHLADLFVRKDRLGQGLGRPLLAAVLGDRWPRTTFASDDARALPSYVRAGMAARWVALYLRGGPDEARRAGASPLARGREAVAADAAELAELERAWTGADRPADHAYWASLPGADPFVVRDASGPVALAYGRDRQSGPSVRAVDRLVIRPGAEPVGPVLAAMGRGIANGARLEVMVPGPHPALPVLLELGFRIEDRDVYCAGPTDPVDPERLLPNSGLL